jgi:hypothetical protein
MAKGISFYFSIFTIFTFAFTRPLYGIVNGVIASGDELKKTHLLLMHDPSNAKNISSSDEPDHSERCTGFAISDQLLVTAGHCVVSESLNPLRVHLVQRNTLSGKIHYFMPSAIFTEFKNDYPDLLPNPYPVIEGCSDGEVPLKETKSLDIAILKFPNQTFSTWFELSEEVLDFTQAFFLSSHLHSGSRISFWGYGTDRSTRLFSGVLYPEVSQTFLRKGQAPLMRLGTQIAGLLSSPLEAYGDAGDSGGPVIWQNKVIGVLTATDEKCETPLGQDYGLWTLFSRLDSAAFKSLLVKAKAP